MPDEKLLKILFVINPVSGGNNIEWAPAIRRYFEGTDKIVETFELTGGDDKNPLTEKIQKFGPGKVVAVGGDGTVALVAKQILGSGIALGILPGGSANGMATELGIPTVVEKALDIVTNGSLRDADVIRINSDYVSLHLSDIGLNATLIKHFEEGNRRGKLGYAKVVLKTLWRRSLMHVHIKIDDLEIHHRAEMVVLANASKYGTGALINPEGNIYDGHFEVVIMRKLAFSELFKMWFRFRPFDPSKMKVFPATSVSIHTNRKVHFQVDGEYLGKVKKVDAEILAGKLKLIVP